MAKPAKFPNQTTLLSWSIFHPVSGFWSAAAPAAAKQGPLHGEYPGTVGQEPDSMKFPGIGL